MTRPLLRAAVAATWLLLAGLAQAVGIPPAYAPMIVEPVVSPGRAEFDLGPALARAKRENRRLYVYLGASDCPYCRRYENFLAKNSGELAAHFKPWIVVDLHSALMNTANQLFFRVGNSTQNYTDFQRSIGDQRTRMLVYPSVWLFDPQMKPLMQMPAGTGTFETVEEQVEILNLVQ
jgi:thiol-disulfide isomerase/thioredoxin